MRRFALISAQCLAMSVTLLAGVSTASAEVTYRESVRTFELGGQIYTREGIWNAIRRYGKTNHKSSSTVVGWANLAIGYRVEYEKRGSVCRPTNVRVDVRAIINLPHWSFVHQASPDVRDYYSCVKETVTVHERRHGDIARKTGEELERRLIQRLDGIPCREHTDRAKAIYEAVLADGSRRQRQFDERDYARNRYQKCQNPNTVVRSQRGAYSMADGRRSGRTLISGQRFAQRSTPRSQRVSEVQDRETRRAGVDGPEGETGSEDGRETGRGRDTDRSADQDTFDWDFESFAQSGMALFGLLSVLIGFVVWRTGRTRKAAADGETVDVAVGGSEAPPAWMASALEAASSERASAADDLLAGATSADDGTRAIRPRNRKPGGFGRRDPKRTR